MITRNVPPQLSSDYRTGQQYDAWIGRSNVTISVSLFGYEWNTNSTSYIKYGRADRKVNNAITFEQSVFSEIQVLKTFEVSC